MIMIKNKAFKREFRTLKVHFKKSIFQLDNVEEYLARFYPKYFHEIPPIK